ncbi:MAG: DUF4013 domain-containing protein [Syntrophomonas sp.]|nr:DUF4013 domain-containing protein [Syntrophomonas sp.]
MKQLFRFPFEDREWPVKILLGTVITIVPILNFLSLGYFVKCIKYGWHGRNQLPDWNNWSELFKEGATVFLISLAYLVIPLLLGGMIALLPGIGIGLAAIIIFIMALIIPMAIANYVLHRNIKDAFRVGEIIYLVSRVFSLYIMGYLTVTLAVILGVALLTGIPLIGFIGGVFIFYCGIVYSHFLGRILHQATRM